MCLSFIIWQYIHVIFHYAYLSIRLEHSCFLNRKHKILESKVVTSNVFTLLYGSYQNPYKFSDINLTNPQENFFLKLVKKDSFEYGEKWMQLKRRISSQENLEYNSKRGRMVRDPLQLSLPICYSIVMFISQGNRVVMIIGCWQLFMKGQRFDKGVVNERNYQPLAW